MSKIYHQAWFWNCKVTKFCINDFPRQYIWKEYSRTKSANAENFPCKGDLVVNWISSSDVIMRKDRSLIITHAYRNVEMNLKSTAANGFNFINGILGEEGTLDLAWL